MVICHVLSSFNLGGQERVALDLATCQRERGHKLIAASLSATPEGELADRFRSIGVETFCVPKGPRFDPSLSVRLGRRLTRECVEIVHTHNPHALVYGAPAGKLAGAAVIHTKHGMNPDLLRRLWLRRAAAGLVDAYVAVTPALAQVALRNHECDPAILSVVPNGIDVTRFAPNPVTRQQVRAELGIPDHAWIVGTVGRLAAEKDQALLIRAMAPLLDDRNRLIIVGDGPEREALKGLSALTQRAKYIHMTGSRPDVERLLSAFDVFALTSRTEGLPLVLLEAMSTGLPVVATSVGGIPDVVERGFTGFLVSPGDVTRLRGELTSLSSDWRLAQRIGQSARRRVLRRYSVERMARDYEMLYASLLERRAQARAPAAAFHRLAASSR